MKNFLKKYTKSAYLTYFISLINLIYIFQFISNQIVLYLQKKELPVGDFAMFLLYAIVLVFGILVFGGFIYIREKSSYGEFCDMMRILSLNSNNKVMEYGGLKKGIFLKHGIYNFEYIKDLEKNVSKGNEIWIISGDMEEDTQNNSLVNIIGENLQKGVIYRYLISKVNGEISNKAKIACEKFKEAYSKYIDKNLFIKEIDYELIAPDVDIIIYNANAALPSDRKGYVCIEIGEDKSTYSYQELSTETVVNLIDLDLFNTSVRKHRKKKDTSNSNLRNWISIGVTVIYWIITGLIYAVCAIKKGVSMKLIIGTLVLALIIWLFTIIAIEFVDTLTDKNKSYVKVVNEDRQLFSSIIEETNISNLLQTLITKEEIYVCNSMHIGNVNQIVATDQNCRYIWLLTDLSHDIGSKTFRDWLKKCLDKNSQIKCRVLYPDNTRSRGRESRFGDLDHYSDRIEYKPLKNESDTRTSHYIWSKTYGILFLENNESEHELFISLGAAENPLFKKVETTEDEAATVSGILSTLWKKANEVV